MSMMNALARAFGRGTTTETKSITLTDPAALALFGIAPSASGIHVSAASAMRVPAVACAVGLIAETCAGLPFKLYARADKSALTEHPAYRLIHDEANPWQSAEELREELTTDALLRGNGYALVVRNGMGAPLELHRLDPDTVTPEKTQDGEPCYRIRQASGGDRLYPFTEVLHLQAFVGVSPIILGREAIGLAIAAEAHLAGFHANGGRPSGIIMHPNKTDAETGKKIAGSWFNTHGREKAGGTAFLDEGMTYQPVTGTHVDAQFLENRIEQIREVARIFRIPPTMLMELSRGTWSNSEQMGRQFLTMTLRPWLKRWQAAYARVLLTPEERATSYVETITDDLLTIDHAARATAYSQYRAMGAMTANEVRAGLNRTPRPDGDELLNPYTSSAHAPTTPDNDKESAA